MCGIFAAMVKTNHQLDAVTEVMTGLKRLEYRGYDSWGVAVVVDGRLHLHKKIGQIGRVQGIKLPPGLVAIGHTRWATHGPVTDANAHPHLASDGRFALAQNGIVQNYAQLKAELVKQGWNFQTQTDTEVIVRLIESHLRKNQSFKAAIRATFQQLEGRNSIALLTRDGKIWAARQGSPLVMGIGDHGLYLSSDSLSMSHRVKRMIVLDNNQILCLQNNDWQVWSLNSGRLVHVQSQPVAAQTDQISKVGHSKRIYQS